MRYAKQTAATFFFAGALAFGVVPAASAATAPAGPTTEALSTGGTTHIQVPAKWKQSCRYDMWDRKTCKWVWVKPGGTVPDNGSCFGGYGPMCPGFAVQPRETSLIA
jgi:hypothetical protein